ncbi:methylated-DNA-[protein]-cysteine S-methyltransferase [Amycolatopsis arida]|uniref:Methylated-DNA-[protein]-cysteine S-methyltransferase n=1 Tax=Amycolatopsis arida TaxID=587909 RepID=A0A1I5PQG9_9PSEU|nr:methylated-DNA--[protein]-cysteine S-methyltransferase [Amycolatopsis arida]TDX98566.1 methylated-DNA-[protein]-cysteine S-methyltransferase [Amycolatopsis arida]SFP36070.1 methylated-DNA-[protein]-cysteine S-methyltransferase [Amycolatopsis arida]
MNLVHWSTMDTPIGPFTAVLAGDGAVLASGWTAELDQLTPQIAPSLAATTYRRVGDLGPVSVAVRRYHAGELDAVDDVPVRQRSGEFLQRAWEVLRTVPAGEPVTYTSFAELAGRPAAVRAAAAACARNAAALFVPCHRVVRVGGALGGFRWGLDVKRWLLDHEARSTGAAA